MTLLKAGALALMIPAAALTLPVMAQNAEPGGPRQMIFADLDVDGSGTVTLEELQAAGQGRFVRADANGDGALSRDELLDQSRARAEASVDRLLERADTDGDDQLTQAEMEAAREARGERRGRGRSERMPERMFERMDADGDGAVSEAEFNEAVARMQDRMGRRHGDRG